MIKMSVLIKSKLNPCLMSRYLCRFLKFLFFIIIWMIILHQIFDIKIFKNYLSYNNHDLIDFEKFSDSLKAFLAIYNNSLFYNDFDLRKYLFIIEPCLLNFLIVDANYCTFNHNLISIGIFSQHFEGELVSGSFIITINKSN